MKDITIELDQIRAQLLCVSLAVQADPMPTPETISLALNGLCQQLDELIQNRED